MFTEALDAIYTVLGVEAVLTVETEAYDLTVIDKTSGIELALKGGEISSIYPAAVVRTSDLVDAGISSWDTLLDAVITFNGGTWRVIDFLERPVPSGD